jgi:hypothetical protein
LPYLLTDSPQFDNLVIGPGRWATECKLID